MNEALKSCRRLAAHAQSLGRAIAAAVTERFCGRVSTGGGFADLYQLQLGLADKLEALRAELVAWADRHAAEIERGQRLRDRRESLVLELRQVVLRLKDAFTGACDAGTAGTLLHPIRRLAAGPAALLEQVKRFHALLADPALESPATEPGVEIDPALAAGSLEEPMEWLGETLAELSGNEAAVGHAKARRDEALEAVADFAGRVARYYGALCDLVGEGGTAGRPGRPRRR